MIIGGLSISNPEFRDQQREKKDRNTNPLLLEQIELSVSFGVEGSTNRRPCCHTSAQVRPYTSGLDKVEQATRGWHVHHNLPQRMSTGEQCWQRTCYTLASTWRLLLNQNKTKQKNRDDLERISKSASKQCKVWRWNKHAWPSDPVNPIDTQLLTC